MLQIDERRDYARWMICGATVLGVHLASAAAYIHWAVTPAPPAAPPPSAMMVELAALHPSPAPAADAAAGPEQVENEPEPEPEPQPEEPLEPLPEPEPEPEPEPDPEPPKEPEVALPEPEPEPARETPPTPQPPDEDRPAVEQTSAPVAAASPAEAVSASPPGVDAATQADALLSFQQRLLAHLERHRRYPYAARKRRQEGVAHLAFMMNREGEVLSFQLEKSSGHRTLDREVLAMIARAAPLPGIPDDIEKDQLELVIPVEFFIRNRH